MISLKKLIKMARTWQKFAATSRKRVSFSRSNDDSDTSSTTSSTVQKGHFVICTADQKRFVMPLSYLTTNIMRELFKMSEEEFGLSSNGRITLPCDASFMEYVVSLVRQGATKALDKDLVKSMNSSSRLLSFSYDQGFARQRSLVCGY